MKKFCSVALIVLLSLMVAQIPVFAAPQDHPFVQQFGSGTSFLPGDMYELIEKTRLFFSDETLYYDTVMGPLGFYDYELIAPTLDVYLNFWCGGFTNMTYALSNAPSWTSAISKFQSYCTSVFRSFLTTAEINSICNTVRTFITSSNLSYRSNLSLTAIKGAILTIDKCFAYGEPYLVISISFFEHEYELIDFIYPTSNDRASSYGWK